MKHKIRYGVFVILFLLVIGFLIWKISNSRSFQFFGGIVNAVPTREKVAALTFDDGPTPKTDTVLAILRTTKIKATFFLVGRDIQTHPLEAKKIAAQGHQIGNHTYSHRRMVFKSLSFIKKEIEETDRLIRKTGYWGVIQFRPPYGKKLFFLPYYLNQKGRKTILWTMEPNSYPAVDATSAGIVRYTLDHLKPGSIILLHPMYDNRGTTINSLRGVIEGGKRKGYRFVTVNELLSMKK